MSDKVIEHLIQAKDLAFKNVETLPQVLKHVISLVNSPDSNIKLWCIEFLHELFVKDKTIDIKSKVSHAISLLDSLIILSNYRDINAFKSIIDVSSVVYRLVFRYVAENENCNRIWSKLTELKNLLVNKFQTNFPLDNSDNDEHDLIRNLKTKIELLKFIFIVIDYQSKSSFVNYTEEENTKFNSSDSEFKNTESFNTSINQTSSFKTFSLDFVDPNHTLIKYSNMEYESVNLLDLVLKTFNHDILIPQLFSATLNHSIIIMKRKPQYVDKIIDILENYDVDSKFQSNYQSIEQFKLSKKYVERTLKIFIQHICRNKMFNTNQRVSLIKKLNLLNEKTNEVRKKYIFSLNNDQKFKKRKFEGFYNSSKKIKVFDYKNLYCLNEINNELNNFDLTTLPQNVLLNMVISSLQKVSVNKLNKALEIISKRYIYGIESKSQLQSQKNLNNIKSGNNAAPNTLFDFNMNQNFTKKKDNTIENDDEKKNYPDSFHTTSKELTYQEKKEHINIIINNFFKLAKNSNQFESGNSDDNNTTETSKLALDHEITKLTLKTWKNDTWLLILTRLATRGMNNFYFNLNSKDKESYDFKDNEQMSDIIRNAIFEYFLDNIHSRINVIIEWLNEEWYSEKVLNYEYQIKDFIKNYLEDQSSLNLKNEYTNMLEVENSNYNKWTLKVLDSMIPFLEQSDRKIFIRLLSDLPYLNQDLIQRIKSLCLDPVRSKIGFLSLQFLIMYRPPVKDACINILKELNESDQDDLRNESKKLLTKYNSD